MKAMIMSSEYTWAGTFEVLPRIGDSIVMPIENGDLELEVTMPSRTAPDKPASIWIITKDITKRPLPKPKGGKSKSVTDKRA